MGAFLLISDKAKGFDTNRAIETIRLQCLTNPHKFSLPGWELYLFPKALISTANYLESESFSVFATGTPFIPGYDYSETLDRIVELLKNGPPDPNNLCGLYFVLLFDGSGLKFMTDSNGLYSIYHTSDGNIISSSFLSLCDGVPKLSPDREAISENLLTGSLVGAETIFSEIKRFEPSFPFTFSGLGFIQCSKEAPEASGYKTRSESLDAQIEVLDSWFSGMKPLAENNGVDSGITGGLDSRMLFALCRHHFASGKLQFHSHRRKTADKDFLCGIEICRKTGMEFTGTPVTDISDITGEEIAKVMTRGMLFNDGQVRTHSFWHEEFNTSEYRIRTLNNKRLGLSGIGGEQYRNMERFMFSSRSFRKWISFELIEKYCGNNSASRKMRSDLTDRLDFKISTRLGTSVNAKTDLLLIKRYMNEIYNPANRGLRSSHENRLSFYLSPFADVKISREAYRVVDHLGLSISYEAELINRIDPEVASFNSAYGFSFNRREPFSAVLRGVLFSNFVPSVIQSRVYNLLSSGNNEKWGLMHSSFSHLGKCTEALESLSLQLNVPELIKRTDLGPLVFAMGHLLLSYREKLNE